MMEKTGVTQKVSTKNLTTSRLQTLGEEVANSVSHGIGFLAAVAVTPFLVVAAIPHGAGSIVGVSIFAVTMAALFLASPPSHATGGPSPPPGGRGPP